jgi:tryptophan-rich sensory protein
MSRFLPIAVFALLTLAGGILIGTGNGPGAWFDNLTKPSFNPPGWVFGPVWTVLYILIGIAGGLVWRGNARGLPMQLWFAQLALNFAWSPVFFSLHRIGLALVIILAMLALIVAFVATAWRAHRTAALLFLPYLAWVAFATMLNAAFFVLN